MPCNDPVNALVHVEDGTAVHSVMVGGRMVVENHKLLTVDLAKLAREIEDVRARLQRTNRPARAVYDRLEKVVTSFCPGLARQPLHIHRYGASHAH
jgi:guanine deaminase